ncbi:CBS domain-containing protein [Candidatus Woesearchaeota archaeon]|nr:CBS domain-containing protein [Candidatus Woesearchaeota archaeon]
MLAKDLMTQDYISVDQKDTVSKLLGRFITKKQKQAIVLDGNKYMGIVDKKIMLNSRIKVDEVKVKKFVKSVHKLDKDAKIRKACEQMAVSDCHILPILYDDGRVEGVVLAKDIISRWKNHAKGYKVRDIERGKLTTLEYHTPIGKVISVLRHSNLSHIPIVEFSGHLVGIVSPIDILEKFSIFPAKRFGGKNIREDLSSSMKERSLMDMPIQSYITRNVETVKEDDELEKAIDIMLDKNLSDVIIISKEKPTGIITIKDILRLFSVV